MTVPTLRVSSTKKQQERRSKQASGRHTRTLVGGPLVGDLVGRFVGIGVGFGLLIESAALAIAGLLILTVVNKARKELPEEDEE